jgi:uncharacterized protein (DUF433 family)
MVPMRVQRIVEALHELGLLRLRPDNHPSAASAKTEPKPQSALMFHAVKHSILRMKNRKSQAPKRTTEPVELGQYIVADPKICHGKLTFKGTRIFVADVLSDVERGLSWDFITHRWGGGKISKAAIAEAVHLARNALLKDCGRLPSLSNVA